MKNHSILPQVVVLAGLASAISPAAKAANSVDDACGADIDRAITDHFARSFPRDGRGATEVGYLSSLNSLITERCRDPRLSADDIREIIEATVRIADTDPARRTNAVQTNMANVAKHVKFGLEYALAGICQSDLGAAAAVRHCVCTEIRIERLPRLAREPDCG